MKVFPGSFPPPVFNALSLDDYGAYFDLAVTMIEEEAEAAEAARDATRS